jgi:hypothetical protein
MLKFLKTLTSRAAGPSASPRESVSAGHGLHRPISPLAALPPDRRGRLKNGNRSGDFLAARRCGARTRCGDECRQPAMRSGRCRLHGGLSTGPRTPAGLTQSRRARLTGSSAGHGVHRSKSNSPVGAPPCGRPNCGTTGRPHGAAPTAASTPSSAGHGVHRSNSTAASGMTAEKIHHRVHRDHRGALPPLARAARIPPSSVLSVPSVVNPSSAGHGLHRPIPAPGLSASIRVHLRSSAASIPFSAGHGVHRSNFDTRPALR